MPTVKLATEWPSDKMLKRTLSTKDGVNFLVEKYRQDGSSHRGSFYQTIVSFLTAVFLPEGYPDSVSADYTSYQTFDTLQSFFNSISTALTTHAVLSGAGVGNANASVAAATISWLFKETSGRIGGIAFAYVQGSQLDADCKKWRLFADIVNDLSAVVNLICPFFPSVFPFLQATSGLILSMVGVAGGSTRAALSAHQARRNNVADVSAKDGSQETLVNFVAFLVNITIVPFVLPHKWLVWTVFVAFVIFHIYFNYRAVKAVQIEHLNLVRMGHLVQSFLKRDRQRVLSIKEVNLLENVWFWKKTKFGGLIKMGASIREHDAKSPDELDELMKIFDDCDYVLSFNRTPTSGINTIKVSLSDRSDKETVVRGAFHGLVLDYFVSGGVINGLNKSLLTEEKGATGNSKQLQLLNRSKEIADKLFEDFRRLATSEGFKLNYILIPDDNWRYKKSN